MGYFSEIGRAATTLWTGLRLTARHFRDAVRHPRLDRRAASDQGYFDQEAGIFTIQYPHESFPVPDIGRYRLHNEIDDCIVCDKCAKVCPVDCIEIEPIKATEQVSTASDGTPIRLYAAKFDIDMAKCCFCGLCTAVCPTECLTMTKVYDFSEYDIGNMNYHFATMSLAEVELKRQEAEEAKAKKAKLNSPEVPMVQPTEPPLPTSGPAPEEALPGFKPKVRPVFKKAPPAPDAPAE